MQRYALFPLPISWNVPVLAQIVPNIYLNHTKPRTLTCFPLEVKNMEFFDIQCNAKECFRSQLS